MFDLVGSQPRPMRSPVEKAKVAYLLLWYVIRYISRGWTILPGARNRIAGYTR